MSTVKANKIQTLNGDTYNVPIQVVKTVLGDSLGTTSNDSTQDQPAWVISTTTTTWTDTSNLQLTITPRFANSLIKLELHIYAGTGAAAKAAAIRIVRGTTILWRPTSNSTGPFSLGYISGSDGHFHHTLITYDSPNTTSPVTYRLQYRTYSGGSVSNLFGWPAAGHYAPINTFTAMEIAQ